MATVNNKLDVTDLDYDQIKGNLKSFLSNQTAFTGYDFSGSGLNQILNLLAYNTHYNAYYMNMLANEMFMDSASIRNSIVSKARMLNYTPRSMIGSSAKIQVTIPGVSLGSTVTVDKFTKFNSTLLNKSFTYCTTESTTITPPSNGVYTAQLNIKEGYPVTFTYTKDSADKEQKFVIPNANVDISTLEVVVKSSSSDTSQYIYTKADDFTAITSTANIYFTSESSNGRFEVEFGDGNVGRGLTDGNIIQLKALICNGEETNGAYAFDTVDSVGGHSGSTITTVSAATGGADRESLNSIKFNAPKTFSSQKRAVSAEDYKALIFANFPEAESIQTWGGETSATPVFGRVYIAVKPKGTDLLTTAQKNTILGILSSRKILAITPEVVDPVIYKIEATVAVKYDSMLTNLTSSQISSLVRTTIADYNTSDLRLFDTNFKYSKLLTLIDKSEDSIKNSLLDVKAYTTFTPSIVSAVTYYFYFNNAIKHPFDGYEGAISSSTFSYADVSGTTYTNCKIDDLNGIIRVYRLINTVKTIVRQNIGTVDYTTGTLTLSAFNPSAITNNIVNIFFEPNVSDLSPVREQILQINDSDVTISITDVNSVERRGVSSSSTTSTTYSS
jgi:hypothetical protein